MANLIGKLYEWFWKDLLQRKEPFTFQFRRMAKAHPLIFWGSIGTTIIGFLGGLGFMVWFIPHILEVW